MTRVVDGDTIDVLMNGQTYRVRYIGMNTPETNQVCGSTATTANSALVANQEVFLIKDVSETDQFGRLLRYVYVGNTFINAELVRQGYAQAATYPPDVAHANEFSALEAEARNAMRGCWATNVWTPVSAPPPPPHLGVAAPPVTVAARTSIVETSAPTMKPKRASTPVSHKDMEMSSGLMEIMMARPVRPFPSS